MKTNHTTGEWYAIKPEASNGFWYINNETETTGSIATCYGENAENNAKLIAAAPDLLEQLIKAKSLLELEGWSNADRYIKDIDKSIERATT